MRVISVSADLSRDLTLISSWLALVNQTKKLANNKHNYRPTPRGPLGWLVPSEIQPLETRAAGTGINTFVNFMFTFLIGQIFLVSGGPGRMGMGWDGWLGMCS